MKGEPIIILMVEDNADHAEMILRCFEEHRIVNRVIHVSDGEEALNYLDGQNKYEDRDKYPLPNLVLLDLRIPKIDGLQVLMKIKQNERLKHIAVVVLSSSENEKDMYAAYSNYVNGYLVKPLDYEKFNKMVESLDLYWTVWNKYPYNA